jgi:hypothetical protein
LPLILIPGLIAAGIGSLVFIGMTNWTGLDTSAYSLAPLELTAIGPPTVGEIAWTIALGLAAAVITYPVRQLGLRTAHLVPNRPFAVVPAAGFVVAVLASAFAQLTDEPANLVLFSGQDALGDVVNEAGTLTVGTLILLMLSKGVAWGVSLGSFRGGPTFPAMFIGVVGGIAASHLPGLPSSVAIPVALGAMIAAFLRLPLSAIVIATLLCGSAGPGIGPLVIVGVVVSYLATLAIEDVFTSPDSRSPATPMTSDPAD